MKKKLKIQSTLTANSAPEAIAKCGFVVGETVGPKKSVIDQVTAYPAAPNQWTIELSVDERITDLITDEEASNETETSTPLS